MQQLKQKKDVEERKAHEKILQQRLTGNKPSTQNPVVSSNKGPSSTSQNDRNYVKKPVTQNKPNELMPNTSSSNNRSEEFFAQQNGIPEEADSETQALIAKMMQEEADAQEA